MNSNIQAMAIPTNLIKKMHTICNIYLPLGQQVTVEELRNLSDQLPRPFLMVGDFNGKPTAWGNNINDQRGRTIEQFLIDTDICPLNTGEATHTFRWASPQHLRSRQPGQEAGPTPVSTQWQLGR
jgi:hypothetical protein